MKVNYDLMGKMVVVTKVLKRTGGTIEEKGNPYLRWVEKDLDPRRGWVVGFRHLNEGEILPEQRYSSGEYDPPSFRTKKRVPCVLVAFWPTENPVKVPVNGFRICTEESELVDSMTPLHSSSFGAGESRARSIKSLAVTMEEWPRDEKGRFRKWPSPPK